MATIKHKRGTSNPSTSDVAVGELAINTTDGGVFTQTDGGSVVEVGASPTSSEIVALVADQTIAPSRIELADNEKLVLGNLPDLKIWHDGYNSFIQDTGFGQLRLHTSELNVVTPYQNSMIRATPAGSIKLYHAASNTTNESDSAEAARIKLETSSTGITVTGTCTATTFSGSGASLTNIPSAQLTGALPAIDGSNLTGLSSGGVSSDSQYNTVGGGNSGDSFSGTSAQFNTLYGYNTGTAITSGNGNVHIGYQAGESITTNGYTTFVGYQAGKDNTANWNVGIGGEALKDCTSAVGATAVGGMAATNVTTGGSITAVGYEACKATKDSYQNTGIGYQALRAADNAGGEYTFFGSWNTAVGANSLDSLTTGRANTCVGVRCGDNLTTGYDNVAVGYEALKNATGAVENTAIGSDAGKGVTGSYNTLIGRRSAFVQSLSGSNNILIGNLSQASSTSVSNECTIGATGQFGGQITKFRVPGCNFSLKSTTATEDYVLTVDANGDCGWEAIPSASINSDSDNNTVGGSNAGDSITNGTSNTFFGFDAGTGVTTGNRNTAFGKSALASASATSTYDATCIGDQAGIQATGGMNTCIGGKAGQRLTSGMANTFVGVMADGTGSYNVCLGQQAGQYSTGSNSIAIGGFCGQDFTGNDNNFIGYQSAKDATSATQNVCIGRGSAYDLTTGKQNIIIGHDAANSGTNDLTTGDNNIIIGHDAAASSSTVDNEITFGDANITKFRIPGINFILKDNGGTPTNGHVLTVDSNGEAGFAAAAGGGGPTGGGSDEIFTENDQTMTTDYTITNNKNAMAAGPITINNGVTLTIGAGETVTIV